MSRACIRTACCSGPALFGRRRRALGADPLTLVSTAWPPSLTRQGTRDSRSIPGRLPSRQGRLFLGATRNMPFRTCAAVLQKPASVPAIILFALTTASGVIAQAIPGASPDSTAALSRGEWPAYAGTYAAARYSPLTQIDRTNAKDLRVAWRWKSPDHAVKDGNPKIGPTRANESTPLMIDGTLYTSTSLSQVAAIDAATGRTKWVFDPKVYENGLGIPANDGWLHRGVAYWRDGDDERVVILTAFAHLIALDARTGKPIATFGSKGWVDLTQGLRRPVDRDDYTMSSPPLIIRGVIVVGSSVMDWWRHRPSPPGDVRGFDARTGRLLWTFNTVPQPGEPGIETWEKGSWKEAGNANVWAPMSADEELGYVYVPVSTPTNDYYGGHRPGMVCMATASSA
jgi:quinoprotein glucose dehydrogenase